MRIACARAVILAGVAVCAAPVSAQTSPWSPDGSWIAYVLAAPAPPSDPEEPLGWLFWDSSASPGSPAQPPGPRETLWATRPSTGDSVLLDQVEGMLTDPAWARDGRALVYGRLVTARSEPFPRFELVLKSAQDGHQLLAAWPWRRGASLDEQDRRSVAWSADGDWIVGPAPDAPGLVLLEKKSGRVARRLDDAIRPAWSPDGSLLAFVRIGDPPRIEVLDGWNSEPVDLGATAGAGPAGFPAPSWVRDGSGLAFLASAGPDEGPISFRIERFWLAPPGPEPAWLLNEPTAPKLTPDASASVAFLDDDQVFLAAQGHGRASQIAWLRGERGEVFKRFHPLVDGIPLYSLHLNPRPGRPVLAVRLGAGSRVLPPALCEPEDESFVPLVPDADARAAWQRQFRESTARLIDGLHRSPPGAQSPPPPLGPSRIPLPGSFRGEDPNLRRLLRVARLGDALLRLDPDPGGLLPAHHLSLLVDRVLYPALLGRPQDALDALDRLEPEIQDSERHRRLIGLRAQLALAAGARAQALGLLGYLDDDALRSGWVIEESPGQSPRSGDPFPVRPAWLDQLHAAFDGILRQASEPGSSTDEWLSRWPSVPASLAGEPEPRDPEPFPAPPRPAPAR